MKTKVKLAQDLKAHGAPEKMIAATIDGYYDDYESPLATPIIQLVLDCEHIGGNLRSIAIKAKNGEYDGTKEESEAWMEREGKAILLKEFGIKET